MATELYRRRMMYSQPPGWAPPQEVTLYQDATGVIVTSARLVVGPTVYPVRGLTAVQYVELPESHTIPKWLVVMAVVSFIAMAGNDVASATVFAGLLFALAIFVAVKSKPNLAVRILTAGGQIDAVVTSDRARADQIIAALNRAVAGGP